MKEDKKSERPEIPPIRDLVVKAVAALPHDAGFAEVMERIQMIHHMHYVATRNDQNHNDPPEVEHVQEYFFESWQKKHSNN